MVVSGAEIENEIFVCRPVNLECFDCCCVCDLEHWACFDRCGGRDFDGPSNYVLAPHAQTVLLETLDFDPDPDPGFPALDPDALALDVLGLYVGVLALLLFLDPDLGCRALDSDTLAHDGQGVSADVCDLLSA